MKPTATGILWLLVLAVVRRAGATNAVRSVPLPGAPLRGSSGGPHRRLAKEDKEMDNNNNNDKNDNNDEAGEDRTDPPSPPPTGAPTRLPTRAPTEFPTVAPSLLPTFSPAPTANTTGVPTGAPSLAGNERALWPFSIRVEGSLPDETILRRDLELYLAGAMREALPSVDSVSLEPTAWSRRSLQEATLLRYGGVAILVPGAGATEEAVREAQLVALESTSGLSSYLEEFSSQPLALLRLQVADFPPVDLAPRTEEDPSPPEPAPAGDSSSASVAVGAVVGAVVVLALVGLACWHRRKNVPPPPPPYIIDPEVASKALESDAGELPVNTTLETTDSDGVRSPAKPPVCPSTPPPGVALQFSPENGGTVERVVSEPRIDLTRPARNPHGIALYGGYDSPPPSPPPPPPPGAEEGDGESTAFPLEVRTMASNDESMEGYSLVTDAKSAAPAAEEEEEAPATPPPPDPVIEAGPVAKSPGAAGNHPVMRWFGKPALPRPRSAEGFFSSDSESNPASEDPRMGDLAGLGKESETSQEFLHGVEAVSEYSAECASSYKEDDSAVDSSVLSYVSSDTDPCYGLDTGPGFTNGALGYFHSEQQEDEFDLLPRMARSPETDYASDVPSDERHTDRFAEQDLAGFGGSALDAGLVGFAVPSEEEPAPYDLAQGIPEAGSWEEHPEAMEAWVQERRRIRRQARSRREERKQPPLTMEV